MLTQKEIDQMVKLHFDNMASALNKMEDELKKPSAEFNQNVAAIQFGRLQVEYVQAAKFLGIYDTQP